MTLEEKVKNAIVLCCVEETYPCCKKCPYHESFGIEWDCRDFLLLDALAVINHMPEIIRGHWIADARYKEQKCSVCHEFGDGKNYCSHCGARMDKEDE